MNYLKTEQESGRSMVEMLGVLAIIGVLSVGGISGYTTAMNKHKANEILNAAAVRAMAVSSQLQNGAETPTLDEFPDEEVGGATFDGVETIGDKFVIGFNLDSAAVLQQMKNIAGTDGVVRRIDDTDGDLTYNDDLTTGERASDFDGNENGTACTTAGYTWCSDLNQCIADGTCGTCTDTYTGSTTTASGGTKIGSTNCYCPSGTELKNGKCESTGPIYHIIRSEKTHAGAKTACEGYKGVSGTETGWHLASAADSNDGLNFSYGSRVGDTLAGLTYDDGQEWNSEAVWLADCCEWDTNWTTCSNKTTDGSSVTCPADEYSGDAWGVSNGGDVLNYFRGNFDDFNYYSLCVR